MKILVIDTWGESVLDWIIRCQLDGHDVRWFIGDAKCPAGKGLVEMVDDWKKWTRWADLIFLTDNMKYLKEIDAIRGQDGVGVVVGPTWDTAQWEIDRTLGMKVLEKHGIRVPAYKEFSDYDAAIAYVKKENRPFVSKPCGNETDKSLSYVAKSGADLVYMLERWKRSQKLKGKFILQEKIDGIEMGVGGWFGPHGFNRGWEENFEHKKLMNGDLGVATGEQGTVMRFVRRSKLADKMLKPLIPTLLRMGYVGCIDVNCIIDEKGEAWPLEFTNRPGWPSFNIQQAITDGDHAEWMLALAKGHDARAFVLDEIALGVVLSIPDYPYSRLTKKEVSGVPIYGLTPRVLPNVHPCQIMAGEAPCEVGGKIVERPAWVTAGDYVMVVTGTGSTVKEAQSRAYRALKTIEIPNSPMYRTDIGSRLKTQLPKLQAKGYSENLAFA